MRRHRVLVAFWIATIVSFGLGFLLKEPVFSIAAQFVAFVLAAFSVKRAEPTGELRRKAVYRGTLALLLAAAGTVVACAGSTVALGVDAEGESPVVGFMALASLNVLTVILAWRAIVKPAPRRAAAVGLIAVVAELFALVFDVMLNLDGHFHPGDLGIAAMFASWAATWAGALVCIGALISFAPPSMYTLPGARVVDED